LIDDVWSTAAWDVIRSKLPSNNCSSRIIVTTRIDTVAKACSTPDGNGYYIHHMKKLGEEDSKKLFISRAFGSAGNLYPEDDLKDAMTSIRNVVGYHWPLLALAAFWQAINLQKARTCG